ncbi:hypothetical protein [Streptomyces cinereoruber]|uniref:hypothetical protein n=1 Tax=Streptomyces cinereoruber TaxID=67260 RepID=UPI00362B9569
MTDFRTLVALICESTDDESARRIIAALMEWTDNTASPAVPAPRQNDPRPALNERRRLLRAELCKRAEAGETLFQPKDLTAWAERHGRKRPWLQKELKELCESGFLQRDAHGSYTILHSRQNPA